MNRKHPTIHLDDLATKARAILRDNRLRMLPVVDEHKRLMGVISRNDVMTVSSSVSPMRVKGIMSDVRFSATLEMDTTQAAREMLRLNEWYIPVVRSTQDNSCEGVLGLEHIIRVLYDKKAIGLEKHLSEVMTKESLLHCSPDEEVDDIWRRMRKREFASCPVVVKGKLIGILSQQDLLERGADFPTFEAKKGRFKKPTTIITLMKTPAVSLGIEDTVEDAIRLMLDRNIGRIPIVDNKGMLVGIVDREDILRALMRQT